MFGKNRRVDSQTIDLAIIRRFNDDVVPSLPAEHVVIVASPTLQQVVAVTCVEPVVPATTDHVVVAANTVEHVLAAITDHQVVAEAADQPVVAGASKRIGNGADDVSRRPDAPIVEGNRRCELVLVPVNDGITGS